MAHWSVISLTGLRVIKSNIHACRTSLKTTPSALYIIYLRLILELSFAGRARRVFNWRRRYSNPSPAAALSSPTTLNAFGVRLNTLGRSSCACSVFDIKRSPFSFSQSGDLREPPGPRDVPRHPPSPSRHPNALRG